MYTRLNSKRLPTVVLKTENEYEIANDKSCVLMKGTIGEQGILLGPITCSKHAVHVYRNPLLGENFQIITPDDGSVELNTKIAKNKLELAQELDYHFKVFIVRVDLPPEF